MKIHLLFTSCNKVTLTLVTVALSDEFISYIMQ